MKLKKKMGMSQADLYQMRSYAARYNVRYLILVYPTQQKLTKPVLIQFQNAVTKLFIFPLDITVKKNNYLPIFEYISEAIQTLE